MVQPIVVGAYEHPGRELPDHTVPQLLREVMQGALDDAGLSVQELDGFFCDSNAPGLGPLDMMEYLGVRATYAESSDLGGASYIAYLGHVAAAMSAGKCRVALVLLGGLPRSSLKNMFGRPMVAGPARPYEVNGSADGHTPIADYALTARRHMHEYGTTLEQLAWIKVAASEHAQHNPHAVVSRRLSLDEIMDSPMIADPLRLMDSCVANDGGGALVVVHPDVAANLRRAGARVIGHGEANKDPSQGRVELTWSANRTSGALAFKSAGVVPADIDYAGLYDSFTITVLLALEDLGFCAPGEGGKFVEDGGLFARGGRLPFNTDGGGLCSSHPAHRGGMTKVIEAVRQLRGEAHPEVQVPGCELAVVSGTGGRLSTRHVGATAILEAYQ